MSSATRKKKKTARKFAKSIVWTDGSLRSLKPEEAERVELALLGEEHFTPAEAAKLLGVSRPMVSKWIRDGKLPDDPVGTHHRIPREAVFELKRQRIAAAKNAAEKLAAAEGGDAAAMRSVSLARAAAARAVEAQGR